MTPSLKVTDHLGLQGQLLAVQQQIAGKDDYYTPREVFESLGLRFDLDVCAPPGGVHWIPADRFYTVEDDGLAQPWSGRVWMNPPYSQTTPWVRRFIEPPVRLRVDHRQCPRGGPVMAVEHRYRVSHLDLEPEVYDALHCEAVAEGCTVRARLLAWLRERAEVTAWRMDLPCESCGTLVAYEGTGSRDIAARPPSTECAECAMRYGRGGLLVPLARRAAEPEGVQR